MFSFYRLIILKSIIIYAAIFDVHTAYAANVTVTNVGERSYRLQGSVSTFDLRWLRNIPQYGTLIIYMSSDSSDAAYFEKKFSYCYDQASAVSTMNRAIADGILYARPGRFRSTRDNSIIIQCSRQFGLPLDGWEVRIPGIAVPAPARCSVSAPSEVNFGTVNEGDTKSIQIQAPIQCDKTASVRLTLSANSTAGILTMNGTVIKYGINGTSPSAVIKVSAGITSAASLNFTLSDTGNIAGEKQGYILLVSEVL